MELNLDGDVFSVLFISVRVVAGLGVVLFWPGYCLQAVVFPRRSDLQGWERVALSFGLSIGVVAVMAPVIDRLPWGIKFGPVAIAYAVFILLCAGIGLHRRRNLAEEDRFVGIRSMNLAAWWKSTDASVRKAYTVQALALLGGVGVLIANLVVPHPGEQYSEFYIVGADGLAEGFIQEVRLGQKIEMWCGIANHEGKAAEYQIEVRQHGELIGSRGPHSLQDGELVEEAIEFAPAHDGEGVKIEFWLIRNAAQQPYRRLELWIDVKK